MKPTKSKELIKQTALDLNIPEDVVRNVVDYYYSVVFKKIENLEDPTIFLHGLGTLRLSRRKLKRHIDTLEKLLGSNDQEDFKKIVKFNLSKDLLEKKKNALGICNNYYQKIYEKRNKHLEK